jgi:hypothetical protein
MHFSSAQLGQIRKSTNILRNTQFQWLVSNLMDDKERAVRRYLAYLSNKVATVDNDQLVALGKQLKSTSDPIVRLRLLSEIERAKRPDKGSLEVDFVTNAYEWAQENNIVFGAFRALGVPAELLHRAGIEKADLKSLARGKANKRAGSSSNATSSRHSIRPTQAAERKEPVRIDRVQEIVRSQTNRFTISQIAKISEASIATARTSITTLVATGEVRATGVIVGLQGKAPMTYEVVKR